MLRSALAFVIAISTVILTRRPNYLSFFHFIFIVSFGPLLIPCTFSCASIYTVQFYNVLLLQCIEKSYGLNGQIFATISFIPLLIIIFTNTFKLQKCSITLRRIATI